MRILFRGSCWLFDTSFADDCFEVDGHRCHGGAGGLGRLVISVHLILRKPF